MTLAQSLAQTSEVFEPTTLDGLRDKLDPQWVMQALEDTGTVTLRRRRLPAEEMIWLVIGMGMMRDRPIMDIVDKLELGGSLAKPVSDAAVITAKARLGAEPLAWLFAQSGRTWAHRSADKDRFKGLALYGLDGTSLRVPDTKDNAEAFGYHDNGRAKSGYPLVRMVALMALRSHLLVNAAFGSYAHGEYHYAEQLWSELPNDSVCLIDRGFFSAALLLKLHQPANNKHWLMRGKQKTKMKKLKQLGHGDWLVELAVSPEARKKDPTLPKSFQARRIEYQVPGFKPQTLLTSLLDAQRYPAVELVELYHERWELELGYDEIKTEMLDRRESIRSKSPEGVKQEIWGLLLAYNLVRHFMQQAAVIAKCAPTRISFVTALRFVREELLLDSGPRVSIGAIPRYLQRLKARLARFVLPERRRHRNYPRVVKIKMSAYDKKKRAPG